MWSSTAGAHLGTAPGPGAPEDAPDEAAAAPRSSGQRYRVPGWWISGLWGQPPFGSPTSNLSSVDDTLTPSA